uniref:Putative secreted protein n=1 Tax=Ixodes ricinus TaxID=34613 RepID=A0A6B0UV43_IXORI
MGYALRKTSSGLWPLVCLLMSKGSTTWTGTMGMASSARFSLCTPASSSLRPVTLSATAKPILQVSRKMQKVCMLGSLKMRKAMLYVCTRPSSGSSSAALPRLGPCSCLSTATSVVVTRNTSPQKYMNPSRVTMPSFCGMTLR